jgi:hypothetical protein
MGYEKVHRKTRIEAEAKFHSLSRGVKGPILGSIGSE